MLHGCSQPAWQLALHQHYGTPGCPWWFKRLQERRKFSEKSSIRKHESIVEVVILDTTSGLMRSDEFNDVSWSNTHHHVIKEFGGTRNLAYRCTEHWMDSWITGSSTLSIIHHINLHNTHTHTHIVFCFIHSSIALRLSIGSLDILRPSVNFFKLPAAELCTKQALAQVFCFFSRQLAFSSDLKPGCQKWLC